MCDPLVSQTVRSITTALRLAAPKRIRAIKAGLFTTSDSSGVICVGGRIVLRHLRFGRSSLLVWRLVFAARLVVGLSTHLGLIARLFLEPFKQFRAGNIALIEAYRDFAVVAPAGYVG